MFWQNTTLYFSFRWALHQSFCATFFHTSESSSWCHSSSQSSRKVFTLLLVLLIFIFFRFRLLIFILLFRFPDSCAFLWLLHLLPRASHHPRFILSRKLGHLLSLWLTFETSQSLPYIKKGLHRALKSSRRKCSRQQICTWCCEKLNMCCIFFVTAALNTIPVKSYLLRTELGSTAVFRSPSPFPETVPESVHLWKPQYRILPNVFLKRRGRRCNETAVPELLLYQLERVDR